MGQGIGFVGGRTAARPGRLVLLLLAWAAMAPGARAATPVRAKHGMVVSQHVLASQVGADALQAGGTAIDAAVATAFALAVVHPVAGNVGGGGFLLWRSPGGKAEFYDFREQAPAGAGPSMFLRDGRYDPEIHHQSHLAVGVPGTVAGLHLAWSEHGKLPWRRLVEPAVRLARDGFTVSDGLARSLREFLPRFERHAPTFRQFTRDGRPYEAGDVLRQPDLARTLERIAAGGPDGFYRGETARLIEAEMRRGGGLITAADLEAYRARKRAPVSGSYRGYEVLSAPPPSSGGTALLTMLNILEGWDLRASGFSSALTVHRVAEAMRRAFAERARFLGDPDFNPDLPLQRLTSKEHAAELRRTIRDDRASPSSPDDFTWPAESSETTHLSVMDRERGAVSLTYTLEDNYGVKMIVPGAGFLLNNEMGDFNAGPGLTTAEGLVGTPPNLAAPGKRMLSSMTPTILAKDGRPFMVVGSPGGRTIISTVLLTILNVVDFGMDIQDAVEAKRFHHQWLPDRLAHETFGLSPDTQELLRARGHTLFEIGVQGVAEGIIYDAAADVLEGAADRRRPDGAAVGR
jgi:gamma-glutamyltranspeptidase/glutathione hydrolase